MELCSLDLKYVLEEGERYDNLDAEGKERAQATVISYILSRIDNNNKRYVSNETSAKIIISKLDTVKNINSLSNTLALDRKFSNLQIGRSEDINEFRPLFKEFSLRDQSSFSRALS